MVGATRGTPDGFGQPSGSGSEQPPPPPLDLAEFLAAQNELLRQIVQGATTRWAQCPTTSSCELPRFLRNSAPSVQRDRGAFGHGCLDSHNQVQVLSTCCAMFGCK